MTRPLFTALVLAVGTALTVALGAWLRPLLVGVGC